MLPARQHLRPRALCVGVLLVVLAQIGCGARLPSNMKQPTAKTRESYVEVVDADARIYVWHHFLTEEECAHLKAKALNRLERSGVVDTATGDSQVSDIRTSDGMFFNRAEDEVIESIERRLAQWTLTPVHNGEGLQVLRYKKEQKYDAHYDFFFDKTNIQNGGNRWATVLMYLEAAEEGGETVFPHVPAPHGVNIGFSECGKYKLAVKPKKGDAILFHSIKSGTDELEDRSMHGACPVLKGEKWSMTKWIHSGHYDMNDKYDEEYREYLGRFGDAHLTDESE